MFKKLGFPLIIPILMFFLIISCASSKNIQKVDGPEDYYETDSSQTSQQALPPDTKENINTNIEEKQIKPNNTETSRTSKNAASPQPANKAEIHKNTKEKNETIQPPNQPPVNLQDNPLPAEVLEEMGDDNWAKDENKLKIKKKDKDKIRDSSLDDDKWGKE